MASIVLSSVGGAIGNALLPGVGGRILGALGRQEGKGIDAALGVGTNSPPLQNLKVQDSRYGVGIPTSFGRVRVAGNVIWCSDLVATTKAVSLIGGKGGLVGGSSSRTTYSYSVNCAVAIGAGPIGGVATIWADSKVIYQNGIWASGVVGSANFYEGTLTQGVDPIMQSYSGSGQVPAYRGVAYVVLESLQLGKFGNRLPNLTFEVLPVVQNPAPALLGAVNPGIQQMPNPVRNKGMAPLVIEGSSVASRRVIAGGYVASGSNATFNVVEYDVTGATPVVTGSAASASFAVGAVSDHAWAMAPDGRFVVCYAQANAGSPTHWFAIYDSETRQFGAVFSLNLSSTGVTKQIAWVDPQHFVLDDVSGGVRGVRVLARAGLGGVDLGFSGVWGAGSASSTFLLSYAQFLPMAGGLLHIVANAAPYFTTLYACFLTWQGGALGVGGQYTLASGCSVGTGSGPVICLLPTGDGEWTLFFGTVVDMHLMSFQPGVGSVVVTRPWQRLTNTSFSAGTTCHPVVIGNRIVVVQKSTMDVYYRLSEIALNSGSFALVSDGVIVGGSMSSITNFGAVALDGARLLLMGISGFNNALSQLAIVQRCETGTSLDAIVGSILARAGYASGDYDVSALAGISVDGYVLNDAMAAAGALAPLQVFQPFDLVESGAQLVAVLHGNSAGVTIPSSEWQATDKLGKEPLPLRERTRLQEMDLPAEITVDYLDASLDYQIGSQRARRTASRGAKMQAKLRLPIVCTAARAKQIAEERLYTAWAERDHVKIALSRRWLCLDPGDVVDLGERLMRVAQIQKTGGVLEVQGNLIAASPVVSAAVADGGAVAAFEGLAPLNSSLYLMDLPLLRAEDDQPGVYAAFGALDGWTGGALWRAADGVNYSDVAGVDSAAVAGIATGVLPNASPYFMDNASRVNVQVMQGTLASVGMADLLNGANAALLGGEIVQFQNAVLVGPGLYTLSGFLRGRRATEGATGTHVVGESFVLLTAGTAQFLPALLTDRGRAYEFRALSDGQSLGDATDVNFTYGLTTLRPFSPVSIAGSRVGGTGSDLTLNWIRRARKNADWVSYVDVPLDEPVELYDVEIMNGSAVVRTFSGVGAASVVYTAAQQGADWGGGIPASYTVNVYQISSRYGRGQKGTGVV